jgi:hypothetical protein
MDERIVIRFWRHVTAGETDECWEWAASTAGGGYGRFRVSPLRKSFLAHRVSYELHVGPIPEGLQIDHLCRNRACVNPEHLEVVTNRVNTLRGVGLTAQNIAKTECPAGHPYDEGNTAVYAGSRICRTCVRERMRERRAA